MVLIFNIKGLLHQVAKIYRLTNLTKTKFFIILHQIREFIFPFFELKYFFFASFKQEFFQEIACFKKRDVVPRISSKIIS